MHLPLPRASGNKNTPATARNPLGVINRNKIKGNKTNSPPTTPPLPRGKGTKSENCGWGRLGPLCQLGLGLWGEGCHHPASSLGPPKGAGGRGHRGSARGASEDGHLAPTAPFREGTVTPSTHHSSFRGCRRRPHVPPLGTGTRWGGPGPEQGSFFLSLGKIYNFCFFFFFFSIFIFIYIDIYIYTHLVTRKEKKNRIRNNNNKKKYSGLKTIRSYHARRAGDCTRPTSGWRSRGCGPPSPPRAPRGCVPAPAARGGRGRSGGAGLSRESTSVWPRRVPGAAGEEGRGQRLCPSYRDLVGGAPHARDLLDTSAGGAAEGHRPRARRGRAQALGLPVGLAVGCSHLHLVLGCQ